MYYIIFVTAWIDNPMAGQLDFNPPLTLAFLCSTNSHAAMAAAGSTSLAPAATPALHAPVLAHQAPVPAHLPNPNPIDNLPANQNPAPDAPFINPGAANQNMRMNAQGGAVSAGARTEGPGERDKDKDGGYLKGMVRGSFFFWKSASP